MVAGIKGTPFLVHYHISKQGHFTGYVCFEWTKPDSNNPHFDARQEIRIDIGFDFPISNIDDFEFMVVKAASKIIKDLFGPIDDELRKEKPNSIMLKYLYKWQYLIDQKVQEYKLGKYYGL